MRVAEVKTPLLAVFDMMHKDNKVVFNLRGDGSYVESHKSGERVAIDWEGHDPIITMYVLEPEDEDRSAPELCPLDNDPFARPPDPSTTASGSATASPDLFLGPADLL